LDLALAFNDQAFNDVEGVHAPLAGGLQSRGQGLQAGLA
jgi:hypothetical protein